MTMTTALVIGNMIGSGVFLLPASLAAYDDVSIVRWIFSTAGALLLTMVFPKLGRANPHGQPLFSCNGTGSVLALTHIKGSAARMRQCFLAKRR
jgi:amino acid transporter